MLIAAVEVEQEPVEVAVGVVVEAVPDEEDPVVAVEAEVNRPLHEKQPEMVKRFARGTRKRSVRSNRSAGPMYRYDNQLRSRSRSGR